MMFIKLYFIAAIAIVNLVEIFGHGMLMEPVNRGSAWRLGYNTPKNYDDNQNYCGGYSAMFVVNKGKCGVCGDNYSLKRPRPSENGGIYGTGTIVRTYNESQKIQAVVKLSANHMGTFKFELCPLDDLEMETEECFAKYPLKLTDGGSKYVIKRGGPGLFKIDLALPEGVTCKHCSLRWIYRVANSWGICEDGTGGMGCGNQETYRTCSDIAILPNSYNNNI